MEQEVRLSRPIRTTISFSEQASRMINICDPYNLSDWVSKAVVFAYQNDDLVRKKEFMTRLAELQAEVDTIAGFENSTVEIREKGE